MTVPALTDDLNTEVVQQLQITLEEAMGVAQSLQAAGVLETTGTSLTLTDPNMPYEQYEALGKALGLINRSCSWWIGDYLLFGEGAFADKYAQAAHETGLAEQTLLNRVYVCKHVPPSRRRAGLPFSVHAEVAPLPAKEQKLWLDRAERNGWTRADLRAHMKATRKDERPTIQDDEESTLREVALAILRDATPHIDGQHHLIPNEDVARLRGVLGEEED